MFKFLPAFVLALALTSSLARADDYMAAMDRMNEKMITVEMTGDPTHDFVVMMIPHHQSAIDMAQILLKQPDADPEIRVMAEKIISDQKKEIDQLSAWLEKHKQ